MNEQDKNKLIAMNAGLNRWMLGVLGNRRRTRRLSYAEAWREAEKCRRRMKLFGHY